MGFIATHSTSNYPSCELACNLALAADTTRGNPDISATVESRRVPSFSVLARDFTLPRIANDLFEFRLHERKADRFAIRCEPDSLTVAVSNDEYFFKLLRHGDQRFGTR